MRETLNYLVFGWYPYLCLTVFLVGSLVRFDREQYTWRSGSSQLLRRRQLFWGSNLFHVGILVIFARPFRRPADADLDFRHARRLPHLQAMDWRSSSAASPASCALSELRCWCTAVCSTRASARPRRSAISPSC